MQILFPLKDLRALPGLLALALPLWAGDAPKPPAPETLMRESLARQRQAVASMAASVEAQRRAVEKQPAVKPSDQAAPAAPFFSRSFSMPSLPALPAPSEPAFACPPLPATELDGLIESAAQREELAPELLRGVIRQESAAHPCAVSTKGAMGLMQLMPATAFQLGVADAFDPKENVDAGARLLKQLLKMYGGDVPLALGAFNAGPGRVNQAGGVPDIPETLDYVQKVLSFVPWSK